MNLKELLFGWLIKGQYEISLLDTIILFIELFIVLLIIDFISKLRKSRKGK